MARKRSVSPSARSSYSPSPLRRKRTRVQSESVLGSIFGIEGTPREVDQTEWIWCLEPGPGSDDAIEAASAPMRLAILCENHKDKLFQEAAALCQHELKLTSCNNQVHMDTSYLPDEAKYPERLASVKKALAASPRKVAGWPLAEVSFVIASVDDMWAVGLGLNKLMLRRAAFLALYLAHGMCRGELGDSADDKLRRLATAVNKAPTLIYEVQGGDARHPPPKQNYTPEQVRVEEVSSVEALDAKEEEESSDPSSDPEREMSPGVEWDPRTSTRTVVKKEVCRPLRSTARSLSDIAASYLNKRDARTGALWSQQSSYRESWAAAQRAAEKAMPSACSKPPVSQPIAKRAPVRLRANLKNQGRQHGDGGDAPKITGVSVAEGDALKTMLSIVKKATKSHVKREPEMEDEDSDEFDPELEATSQGVNSGHWQQIAALAKGSGKFDPAQNPHASETWRHLMVKLGVETLLQTHENVSNRFLHGPHKGEPVEGLTEKLISGHAFLDAIPPLVVTRCSAKNWVVFGNRRLKALKKFAMATNKPVYVNCIVHDLDSGPAPPALVAKFIAASGTTNGGLYAPFRPGPPLKDANITGVGQGASGYDQNGNEYDQNGSDNNQEGGAAYNHSTGCGYDNPGNGYKRNGNAYDWTGNGYPWKGNGYNERMPAWAQTFPNAKLR